MIASTHPTLLSDADFSACDPDRNSAIFLPFAGNQRIRTFVIGGLKRRTRHNVCYPTMLSNLFSITYGTKVKGNPCPLVTAGIENTGTCAEVTFCGPTIGSLVFYLHQSRSLLDTISHRITMVRHKVQNTTRTREGSELSDTGLDLGFALWLLRTAQGYTMRDCAARLQPASYRQSWARWELSKGGNQPYWRIIQLARALRVPPVVLITFATARSLPKIACTHT